MHIFIEKESKFLDLTDKDLGVFVKVKMFSCFFKSKPMNGKTYRYGELMFSLSEISNRVGVSRQMLNFYINKFINKGLMGKNKRGVYFFNKIDSDSVMIKRDSIIKLSNSRLGKSVKALILLRMGVIPQKIASYLSISRVTVYRLCKVEDGNNVVYISRKLSAGAG